MRAATYVGRVGGLAVALGIGVATGSGVAWADPADSSGPTASAGSSDSTASATSGSTTRSRGVRSAQPAAASARASRGGNAVPPLAGMSLGHKTSGPARVALASVPTLVPSSAQPIVAEPAAAQPTTAWPPLLGAGPGSPLGSPASGVAVATTHRQLGQTRVSRVPMPTISTAALVNTATPMASTTAVITTPNAAAVVTPSWTPSRSALISKIVVGLLLAVGGMDISDPRPNNLFQGLIYFLAKGINDTFDPAPPAGSPTVGVANLATGIVTGTTGFPSGSGLRYTVTQPATGTVVVASDGTFTYTPTEAARQAAGLTTTDTFTATMHEVLSTASVTITVPIDPGIPSASPNTVTATIALRGFPQQSGVTVSPDGRKIYVFYGSPGIDGGKVAVISTVTSQVTNIFRTVGAGSPRGVAISADGAVIYGASGFNHLEDGTDSSALGGAVPVFDIATNTTSTWIGPVGRDPQGVAVSPDGQHVYVANAGSLSVSVISTATNTVTGSISVVGPGGMVVSPDSKNLYVTGQSIYVPGANSFVNGVAIISTATNTITGAIPVRNGYGYAPLAISADGKYLCTVTNIAGDDTVSIISTAANTVVGSPIVVGATPLALAVSPDGAYVYTADTGSDTVSVISTATGTVIATIQVASGPDSIAVNPVTGHVYVAHSQSGTVEIISPGPSSQTPDP